MPDSALMPGRLARVALVAACCAALPARATATAEITPAAAPSRQQVLAAADEVRKDPNLPGSKTEKSLRFTKRNEPEKKKDPQDGMGWLRDFVRSVFEGARVLVWALGALAVAWVAVSLRRWIKVRAGSGRHRVVPLPSHIGELDIRPESLPDDIGSAVAGLWQRGQQRPALSLLYRGALSRLVHLHEVPIRSASTEGECVALSAGRLTEDSLGFFSQLVQAWQLAAYGGRLPATDGVLTLCAQFDQRLGLPAAEPGA